MKKTPHVGSWPMKKHGMTKADYKKHPCEMKLKGGPASGMTVVMPFSSNAGLWFVDGNGDVHHYRGMPGRPGTTLEYVGDGSMDISELGLPTGIPVKDK